MRKKTVLLTALAAVVVSMGATYAVVDYVVEPPGLRAPASTPENYEGLNGCEKQEILWKNVQATLYDNLPEYRKLGLFQVMALSKQEISIKGQRQSDFAPSGWKKYLHGRGALAKVKIVPRNSKYTGLFQGAECGLLRLSLTYKPSGNSPVAPGLALKVLRDHVSSANVSALVSLDGQGKDFNFFKFPMSNIVPIGTAFGQKLVHKIFKKASFYPEELLADDFAKIDTKGNTVSEVVAPRQIFFVPGKTLSFSSEPHEVREDFFKIPPGTTVYEIHVVSDKYRDFNYLDYTPEQVTEFLKESAHVADIVSTSEFVSSEFGDDGIFFRHQLRP